MIGDSNGQNDAYFQKVYNWSLNKTNNKSDAEDLINNIFVAIFTYFNENINIEKVDHLIWKIAHNFWCAKAKKYIKEKNTISLEETYEPSYQH